ncbi:MAG: hypothetical protein D6714_08320, partial [Bacteroidetes bacterium]
MPPLQGWGRVFYSTETRAGKRRETGSLWQSLKACRIYYFSPKNKNMHTQAIPDYVCIGHFCHDLKPG